MNVMEVCRAEFVAIALIALANEMSQESFTYKKNIILPDSPDDFTLTMA